GGRGLREKTKEGTCGKPGSGKKHGTNSRENSFQQKTWNELAGKPASCKKHGTNLREASFLQKTWDEFVGKPASCKKHGTNLRGSQLPAKNTEGNCKRASFLENQPPLLQFL